MNEYRCMFCGRYLFSFEVDGICNIMIKCKSCANVNYVNAGRILVTCTELTLTTG